MVERGDGLSLFQIGTLIKRVSFPT